MASSPDVIPGTPPPLARPRRPKQRFMGFARNQTEYIAINDYDLDVEREVGPLKSEVYIFHTFEEFLKYNANAKPVNKKVKIIGKFRTNHHSIPYMQDCEHAYAEDVILVNLQIVNAMPNTDEIIEVFGHLEFEDLVEHKLPLVVVHFFRQVEGNLSKYIKYLKMQKQLLPSGAFELENQPENDQDSLFGFNQDLSLSIIHYEQNEDA